MKKLHLIALLIIAPLSARADLNIFACEPEWAVVAKEIGGKTVKTDSATNALQDPHYIQARPSLIAKVRRADLVVCSGAQLEIGWLPLLLRKGNNPDVLPGKPGFLEASMLVNRLGITTNADRSQGDVHPQGNPHIQTNPHNILIVAEAMAKRMQQLDESNAHAYQQAMMDFKHRWTEAIKAWESRASGLRGKRVIVHHNSWVYLEDWLGLEEVATLEAVSGVPPTASHLAGLLEQFANGESADIILRAPYQSEKPSQWLSERSGIPAVMLPLSVGGSKQTMDLFTMFDDILERLLSTMK